MIKNKTQAPSRPATYTEGNPVQKIVDALGLGALKMQEQILNELIHEKPSRFKWGYTDISPDTAGLDQNDDDDGEKKDKA